MGAAIAAYTPNIPWARFGCDDRRASEWRGHIVGDAAGGGRRGALVREVQGVRCRATGGASRRSARRCSRRPSSGRARISTATACSRRAPRSTSQPVLTLPKSAESKNSFAFLRVITGLGVVDPPPRERMFNLELAQRWLVNTDLQEIVPDPDRTRELEPAALKKVLDAIIADPGASHRAAQARGAPLSGADRRLSEIDTREPRCGTRRCRGVQRSAGGAFRRRCGRCASTPSTRACRRGWRPRTPTKSRSMFDGNR